MSNNKQSSVEWLESEITKRGPLENNPPQWLKDLYSQAKAMHKEEMIDFTFQWSYERADRIDIEIDYNETFGDNNEQQ